MYREAAAGIRVFRTLLILDCLNYGVPNCCCFLVTVKEHFVILLQVSDQEGENLSFHCY